MTLDATAVEMLALLDLDPDDLDDARRFLTTAGDSAGRVRAANDLGRIVGTFLESPSPHVEHSTANGIFGLLATVPSTMALLAERGIDPRIMHETLADFGRHFRRFRRIHSRFGLANWKWFLRHIAGNLFSLGRLQYQLFQCQEEVEGITGRWVAGIHIPGDSGPLRPNLVDASLSLANEFFDAAFPDLEVEYAVCASWLLDPWLVARLPGSNIERFAHRFAPWGSAYDDPMGPPYFLWGSRDPADLPEWGRSRLENLVLERIASGGQWQVATGYLRL